MRIDSYGTNAKIIRRVVEKDQHIHMLVLISRRIQRSVVKEILALKDTGDRIRVVEGMSKYISGSYFLVKAKKKLLAPLCGK